MTNTTAKKRFGLMGTFGFGNLGDAAIQEAMIQNIRKRYPEAEIFGFSLNPEDTEKRHGIPSFPITRMSWQEESQRGILQRLSTKTQSHANPLIRKLSRWILRLPIEFGLARNAFNDLKHVDILILSGGGPIEDYWGGGGGGPWSYPYTFLKFALLCKLRGIKFIVVSVGAGPLNAKLSQLFIRATLHLSDYRSYRDENTRQLINKIGFKRKDAIVPDLANSLDISNYEETVTAKNSSKVVGIGPVGFFKEGCWPESDANVYAAYVDKMCSIIEWLVERQYDILFLPGEAYYDLLTINDIKAALAQKGLHSISDHFIEKEILSVDDLLEAISITDIVIVSRFHNLLLSQRLQKPAIAISYQSKIDSLMQNTKQGIYCSDISSFMVDSVISQFVSLEENREKTMVEVKEYYDACSANMDAQYDLIFGLL